MEVISDEKKIYFLQQMLGMKHVSPKIQDQIIELASKEVLIDNHKIWEEIKKIKTEIKDKINFSNSDLNTTTQNASQHFFHSYHKPEAITSFLKNFSSNSALKYTTHLWDKTVSFLKNLDSFYNKLNKELKAENLGNLLYYNSSFYNILNGFLGPRNDEEVLGYGWGTDLGWMQIGWQSPTSFKNFMAEQFEKDRMPMEIKIPQELQPKNPNEERFSYFENVVNFFSQSIRFRNYEFSEMFKELLNTYDLKCINLSELQTADFYTYTGAIKNGIDKIFQNMSRIDESRSEISVKCEICKGKLNFYITQLNSLPAKPLNINNIKSYFSGDSISIIDSFFSLCDYSVISEFVVGSEVSRSSPLEICILSNGSTGERKKNNSKSNEKKDTPFVVERLTSDYFINNDIKVSLPKGFTHKLSFFI